MLPVLGCAVVISLALTSALFQGWLISLPEKKISWMGHVLIYHHRGFYLGFVYSVWKPSDELAALTEKIQYCTFPLMSYFLGVFRSVFLNHSRKINSVFTIVILILIAIAWIRISITSTIKNMTFLAFHKEPNTGPFGIPVIAFCYIRHGRGSIYLKWVGGIRRHVSGIHRIFNMGCNCTA